LSVFVFYLIFIFSSEHGGRVELKIANISKKAKQETYKKSNLESNGIYGADFHPQNVDFSFTSNKKLETCNNLLRNYTLSAKSSTGTHKKS